MQEGRNNNKYTNSTERENAGGWGIESDASSTVPMRVLPRLPFQGCFPTSYPLHRRLHLTLRQLTPGDAFGDNNRSAGMHSPHMPPKGIFPSQSAVAVWAGPHFTRFGVAGRIFNMTDVIRRAGESLPANFASRMSRVRMPLRAFT